LKVGRATIASRDRKVGPPPVVVAVADRAIPKSLPVGLASILGCVAAVTKREARQCG
jgi:hypothetical protein